MTDRRTARTKKWLQNALETLLEKKSFESITIQEITDEADTARITFYRHYKDKSELLVAFLNRFYEEIKPILLSPFEYETEETQQVGAKNLIILFKHIYKQRNLYQAILLSSIGAKVRKHLRNIMVEQIMTAMKHAGDLERLGARAEAIAIIGAEGIMGLMIWWLENGCPQSPESLAETATQVFAFGVENLPEPTTV